MLKARVGLWFGLLASMIVISLIASGIKKIDWDKLKGYDTPVQVQSIQDTELVNNVSGHKFGDYNMNIVNANAHIIIKDASNENIDGYSKNSNVLYSLMVLYISNNITENSDGFVEIDTRNSTAYKIDLRKILDGLKNDKTWEDIGINKKVAKEKISITIPNERNTYYSQVVDLFYITMNNGKIPTEEEQKELKPVVDELLKKCKKTYDIRESIDNACNDKTLNKNVFIGPEFLYQTMNATNRMSSINSNCYMPAYFYQTTKIYLDIFEIKDIETKYSFYEKLKSSSDWFDITGFRVESTSVHYSNVKSGTIDFLP